jgi:HSP20 family protein
MFGLNRWSPIEDVFNFQREVDRLFTQFWSDLPTRPAASWGPSFHVNASDDGWRIDVPMPGIDPQQVELEAADRSLHIRTKDQRYQQALTVPEFLDLDKISAAHRHGMLQLTLPLKESVKPRRIRVAAASDEQKQLSAVA